MPQDQSATRMMSTLQTSLSQGSQQFIDPTQGLQQPQSVQPTQQLVQEDTQPDVSPALVLSDTATSPQQADAQTEQIQEVATPQLPVTISDQQKLALFENVMQEVEAAQQQVPVQPANRSVSKESIVGSSMIAPQELPGGMQYADIEPVPEISPEIEKFLQHAQEQPDKLPEEIVQAAAQFHQENVNLAAPQAVKVLPVTKLQAEEGEKKNPSFALRWLVEFSNKVSRLFAGKSIYRAD